MFVKWMKQFPASLFLTAAVVFLSLCRVPHTELDNVPFIDKWVHIVMYCGFTLVLWVELLRSRLRLSVGNMVVLTVVVPIGLSGGLELLQEYATTTRGGDWFDLLANALGVCLSAIVGFGVLRRYIPPTRTKS